MAARNTGRTEKLKVQAEKVEVEADRDSSTMN